MLTKVQAWRSTILGIILTVGLGAGVYSEKLSQEFLVAMVPTIYLVFSDVFKEKKDE
jgi:hypothetical protein